VDSRSFDLENENLLINHIKDIQPNIIIYCAGLTNVDKCEQESEYAYVSNVMITEMDMLEIKMKTYLVFYFLFAVPNFFIWMKFKLMREVDPK